MRNLSSRITQPLIGQIEIKGKYVILSKPQFSHLKNRDSGSDLIGLFGGLDQRMYVKFLAHAWHVIR